MARDFTRNYFNKVTKKLNHEVHMTTKPTISKDELREQIMDIFMAASGMDISPNEYEDQILALIADQQRQLLDRLEAELPTFSDLKGNADTMKGFVDAMNLVNDVIKDIREGL